MTALARIDGTTGPGQLAAAQGTYGLLAVRAGKRDALENYLGTDAAVVAWLNDPATWPCDYAIVRQGGELFVFVYGTTNVSQWSTNVIGMAGISQGFGLASWHAGFSAAAALLMPAIQPYLDGPDAVTYVGLYGHSLGGAVAELLAYKIKAQAFGRTVEVLTFGAPMAATGGQPALTRPNRHWRLVATGDLVPYVPGLVFGWLAGLVVGEPGWVPSSLGYIHYGTAVELATVAGPGGAAGELVSLDPVGAHQMPDYWGRLSLVDAASGTSPGARDTYAAGRALAYGEDVHRYAPAEPGTAPLPSGVVVPVPTATPSDTGPIGSPLVAYPNNELTGGSPLQIVLYFDWGPDVGWSEKYDVYAQAPNFNPEFNFTPVTNLVLARRAILSRYVTLRRALFSRLDTRLSKDVSNKEVDNVFGVGTDAGTAGPSLNYGALLKARSLDGTRKSNRLLKGIPDTRLLNLTSDPLNTFPVSRSWPQWVIFTEHLLRSTGPGGIDRGYVFAIATAQRTLVRFAPSAKALSPEGYLQITVGVTDLRVPTGAGLRELTTFDRVHLFHRRQACLTGLSGVFGVLAVDVGPSSKTVTLAVRPCCSIAELNLARIEAQVDLPAYWAMADAIGNRQGTRNSGRPSGRRRGRRKACCR